MIQDWLNREGGIKGVPVQIIVEDSKSEESQAVLAATLQIVTPADEYKRIIEHPRSAWEVPKVQRPWIFKTPQTDTSAKAGGA
ncbi:MAG: hypothetical protein U1C55_05745 [Smithellaceae bacterium]|nr:hypothetical protein [Smithellaceae bacterium]